MPKKLKTYQTSLGFYDLAIAVPSMKAALEAWGAGSNLFHQGAAREADDPDVIAVTTAKPGVVLKRPAGSDGHFTENSELPTAGEMRHPRKKRSKASKSSVSKVSEKAARKAAIKFERERKAREAGRRREKIEEAKQRERRDRAVAKAQVALDKAAREHEVRAAAIEAERDAFEKRAQGEVARWQKLKKKLAEALHRARSD